MNRLHKWFAPMDMTQGSPWKKIIVFMMPMLLVLKDTPDNILEWCNSYLLIASGLNIVLDLVFVAVLHLGVNGVAYATVISQMISAFFCFRKLCRMRDLFDLNRSHIKWNKKYAAEIIWLGIPSGLTQAILSMSMLAVQSLTNSFGEAVIATNVILMRVDGFAILPHGYLELCLHLYCIKKESGKKKRFDKINRFHERMEKWEIIL